MILLPRRFSRQPQTAATVYQSSTLSQGLIGSWPMQPYGFVRDAGLFRRNTDIINSSSVSWRPGFDGTELRFNGAQASGAVSFGDVDWAEGLSAFTVEFEIFLTSWPVQPTIIGKWGTTAGERSFQISSSTFGRPILDISSGGTSYQWLGQNVFNLNTRFHFVLVWRGGGLAADAWYYVNGVKRTGVGATGAWSNGPASNFSGSVDASTSVFQIGRNAAGNQTNGSVGMVNMWGRAITDAEGYSRYVDRWGMFTPQKVFFPVQTGAAAQTLTPSLFTNSNTFYSPTVTAGTVDLAPSLFTNSNTFYNPTVTQSGVVLQPDLFTNSNTFYSPTVTAGTVDLAPSLFTNNNTFFSPTVSQGGATNLYPELFINTNMFFGVQVINQYPDPSQVEFGVQYGPGGLYTGTLVTLPGETSVAIRSFTRKF